MTALSGHERAVDIAAFNDSEAAEFERELRPLIGDAVRLATGLLMNAVEAEDAVQEACLRAWRRRGNRRDETDLRPWFLGIVANQCRETRRNRWWRVLRTAEGPLGRTVAEPHLAARMDLRIALAGLRLRTRLAVVLRYYLDLPYEEVDSVMGCSIDAAKALVRRGTAELSLALREGGPEQ